MVVGRGGGRSSDSDRGERSRHPLPSTPARSVELQWTVGTRQTEFSVALKAVCYRGVCRAAGNQVAVVVMMWSCYQCRFVHETPLTVSTGHVNRDAMYRVFCRFAGGVFLLW